MDGLSPLLDTTDNFQWTELGLDFMKQVTEVNLDENI
jgi:hypothetical protein